MSNISRFDAYYQSVTEDGDVAIPDNDGFDAVGPNNKYDDQKPSDSHLAQRALDRNWQADGETLRSVRTRESGKNVINLVELGFRINQDALDEMHGLAEIEDKSRRDREPKSKCDARVARAIIRARSRLYKAGKLEPGIFPASDQERKQSNKADSQSSGAGSSAEQQKIEAEIDEFADKTGMSYDEARRWLGYK